MVEQTPGNSKQPFERVTVVVVGYKSCDLLPQALGPLESAAKRGLLSCIVVDNDSQDGTLELMESDFPWARLVINDSNIGFGRACNVGIAHARSDYVLLLNPDATLHEDALERLIEFMDRHPDAGIIGPCIEEADGHVNPITDLPTPRRLLGQQVRFLGRETRRVPITAHSAPIQGEWLCGAVMLLRRAMLEQIGGFDPRFFLYFEETDLCKRAIDAGWQIWSVGESVAYHIMSASSNSDSAAKYHGCISEHYFQSRYYYLKKHFGTSAAFLSEATELLLILALMPWRALRGKLDSGYWVRLKSPKFQCPKIPTDLQARPPG